jgi:enoyl-CoA hydratase/carnithine racemase
MSEAPSTVRVVTDNHVMTILIDRPAKKNALDGATYRGMTAALLDAGRDPAVRAVVLTGGREVFTSGNDLGDFARIRAGGGDLAAMDFLRALIGCPRPVVAAVAGWAVGIGTTMLMHCDFVYAAPTARFKTPFVDLGLCPEGASTVVLARLIGARHAAEMLLLGAEVDAASARAWGLVNDVVDDPVARAAEVAATLARRAPGALRVSKALLARASAADIEAALAAEQTAFLERLSSEEAVEAATALMTRRAPDFARFRP